MGIILRLFVLHINTQNLDLFIFDIQERAHIHRHIPRKLMVWIGEHSHHLDPTIGTELAEHGEVLVGLESWFNSAYRRSGYHTTCLELISSSGESNLVGREVNIVCSGAETQ